MAVMDMVVVGGMVHIEMTICVAVSQVGVNASIKFFKFVVV